MSGTRILVDTNIILDIFLEREPFCGDSKKIFSLCESGEVDGFVAAHSITNAFYILSRDISPSKARIFLFNVCRILKVVDIDERKIKSALLNLDFSDFEDCLQSECAIAASADCIITRNIKDFAASRIKVMTPSNFLTPHP